MAKEAAAKAIREALEAAAKASTAVEAAAAVEREVLDMAPIEVENAPPSTTATTRRYALLQNTCLAKTYCCHSDNMSCIQQESLLESTSYERGR